MSPHGLTFLDKSKEIRARKYLPVENNIFKSLVIMGVVRETAVQKGS